MKHNYFLILFFLFQTISLSATVRQNLKPPEARIGNFTNEILPSYTFAFGQNIYKKGTILTYPFFVQTSAKDSSCLTLTANIMYGITDNFSFYAGLPIIKEKSDGITLRGVGSLFAQFEYAFYQTHTVEHQSMATILANVGFPTNHLTTSCDCIQTSTRSNPVNFLVGTTASHLSQYRYIYGFLGAMFNTTSKNIKTGTTVYYQWGAGHYLGTPMGLTLMGLIECNGLYTQKDKVDKIKDDNSGGNTLYIGPTLCLTGGRWLLSGGVQFPAVQKLNGDQDKLRFRSSIAATVIF